MQRNATHAIQKRDTADREAGKEIEDVNEETRQTSKTHFFLKIDHVGFLSDIRKINEILETITYDYMYKGTDTKSIRQYITKEDFDRVFQTIEHNRNRTIRIEVTIPQKTRNERDKEKRHYSQDIKENLIKRFGEKRADAFLNLILKRFDKEKEIKINKQEMKERIRKLKAEIKKANEDFSIYEKKTNTEIIKLEKKILAFFNKTKITLNDDSINTMIKGEIFRGLIEEMEQVARADRQIDEGNKRQKEWRARKNAESGKPKRGVGRPRKNET